MQCQKVQDDKCQRKAAGTAGLGCVKKQQQQPGRMRGQLDVSTQVCRLILNVEAIISHCHSKQLDDQCMSRDTYVYTFSTAMTYFKKSSHGLK